MRALLWPAGPGTRRRPRAGTDAPSPAPCPRDQVGPLPPSPADPAPRPRPPLPASPLAALTFGEAAAAARAKHQAIDLAQYFAKSQSRLAVFAPAICAHTAFFAAYRGTGGETIGWGGMVQPLLVTALPTAGYAAYTRAAPPAFLSLSLASCVLLHAYDRVWHPRGLNTENMPLARMNRRVF